MPTLVEFGYESIKQNGRLARGGRPLLVILVQYPAHAAFSTAHPPEYYDRLGFGNPNPPFSTANPINPASLTEFFRENSHGRFWFNRVGVIGPISMDDAVANLGPEERSARILEQVTQIAPLAFIGADVDRDNLVEFEELCVSLFENIPNYQPGNRNNIQFQFDADIGFGLRWTGKVQVHVAGSGLLTPFYQIAHELSHSLGTVDLYNTGAGNRMMTLMGGYPFFANDQRTVHLDIWHKLALGWVEPRIFQMNLHGASFVREGPSGAIILWDRLRGASEYFMIERRRPNAPGQRYDADFPDNGVLIWHVQRDRGIIAHLGSPNLEFGGSGVWRAGVQTPVLRWADGQSTGVTISTSAHTDGAIGVRWGEPLAHQSTTRHIRLFHGGTGTNPVDSGLPYKGIFYGVVRNGNLTWNRYSGFGQQPGDPATLGWDLKSGNPIGRGWGSMLHLLGCGDGVIMGVHPNGNLHWYKYAGSGEPDATGTLGWQPNSGNIIGRGWQNFQRIFVKARAGNSTDIVLFAVAQNGDLFWYGYRGDGTHDPTGGTGWLPNSGNQIGRGWHNFRHLHGSSNVFFAGAEDGKLLWYSYEGRGERSPTGALGWHRNSSNPIGRGWQGFTHLFGGVTDDGGFAHILFGVQPNGDLLWYRYAGHGEADEAGARGWDPRSGSRIGTGW